MLDISSISATAAAVGVIIGVVFATLQLRDLVKTRQTDLVMRLDTTFGSKEFQESWVETLRMEFNDYEDYLRKYGAASGKQRALVEGTRRRIDLTKGVALGLFYGIIGNFFVQFFYPVVETLALKEYPKSFWTNVIVSAVSLAIILQMTRKFRSQLKEDERKMKLATESIRREKNAVEELRKILEKDSPQQKK